MLTAAHGTTINILQHAIGSMVSLADRESLAAACPIEIDRIVIPCWHGGERAPHAPAVASRVEYGRASAPRSCGRTERRRTYPCQTAGTGLPMGRGRQQSDKPLSRSLYAA